MTERFHVYVVALKPKKPGDHDVYVGSSALTPEVRFRKHKTGKRGSRHVRRRGVRLLPRLYQGLNPFSSRTSAKRAEQRLAHDLERKGYRVYGSCSPRKDPWCWL